MSSRYPWIEATTPERFRESLGRGPFSLTLANGKDALVVKYRSGVVYLGEGRKVRLSRLVWTPLGYQEIESDETDLEKRAIEALAIMDRHVAIAELDAPRSPLAMLSKRLEEEQEAQRRVGTDEFQTLDIMTEKVIASWLRNMADSGEHDPSTCHAIADDIESGRHRKP